MKEKSALIAMSGGVDSSCAAFLMREQGYECMGTTMRLYRNEDLGACNFRTCCSEKDIEDASEVAFQLDIPYEVLFRIRSSKSSSEPMRRAARPIPASTVIAS